MDAFKIGTLVVSNQDVQNGSPLLIGTVVYSGNIVIGVKWSGDPLGTFTHYYDYTSIMLIGLTQDQAIIPYQDLNVLHKLH